MPCLQGIARSPLALLAMSGLLVVGCGGSSPSTPSGSPTPTPTATPPQSGGDVTGRYLLQITPAPGCALSRTPLTFPMTAAAAGTTPHPGVQIVLDGAPGALELELMSASATLRGGMGTTGDGALSNEGTRLWLHAIGSGSVFRGTDGRGEVTSGTLMGYVALGHADDDEGALGTCSARDHSFTLRTR
jgi:hypothetical protein